MRPEPRTHRPAFAFALIATVAAASARAQEPAPAPAATQAKPPAGPPIPMAHFVPGGDLFVYIESEGLDARADAWKKSSLYQVLNTTPAGAMLEEVAAQLIEQTYGKSGVRWASGKEIVALLEHVARNGFVVALAGKPDDPKSVAFVMAFRGVFKAKEIRPVIGRLFNAMMDPKVKAKAVDVSGHKVVVAKDRGGRAFGFWVEDSRKEDLVFIPPSPREATVVQIATNVLAALDGQHPDASADPVRQALAKEEDGLVPVTFGFANLVALPPGSIPPASGLQDVKGIDFRWGFQDRDTVSILQVSAPKPREGMLAILDQPTFDKSGLPPVPEGVGAFTVVSLNLAKTYDQLAGLAAMAKPDAGEALEGFAKQVQEKTKLRLKEDILAHLGPKFAFYDAPASRGGDAGRPGILEAMLGGPVPRYTLVAEIDDPKAFGRSLEALMIVVNQSLRGLSPMLSSLAPPPDPNAPGGSGAAPGGGRPATKGSRPAAITLEFKQVGTGVYTMTVPPALSSMVPSYLRPTIRMGPKHVAISVSPEAARAALEVKGAGAPGATFATTLQAAPGDLLFLHVADDSEAIATGLAAFPVKLQELADKAAAPPGLPPGFGPQAGAGNPGGSPMPGPSGGSPMPGRPGSMPGMPGPGGSGSMPGGSGGMPGGSGQPAAEGKGLFTIRVDPAKFPTADAIKPLLAPGMMAVSVDDDGIKIISRQSFPDLPAMIAGNSPMARMVKERMAAATAAKKAADAQAAPAPAAGPGGSGGPAPGPGPAMPGRPGAAGPRPTPGRP